MKILFAIWHHLLYSISWSWTANWKNFKRTGFSQATGRKSTNVYIAIYTKLASLMSRTKSETYANIKNLFTMAVFTGFSFFFMFNLAQKNGCGGGSEKQSLSKVDSGQVSYFSFSSRFVVFEIAESNWYNTLCYLIRVAPELGT